MKSIHILLTAAFLACASTTAHAAVPERTKFSVNDYADMIRESAQADMERWLKAVDEMRNIEVIVTTIDSLEGMDFDLFMAEYVSKWKSWPAGEDRRVHIVVAKNEQQIRTILGSAFLKVLPEDEVKSINSDMTAFILGEQCFEGLQYGIVEILKRIQQPV